jgi:hypothetical protein
MHVPKRFKQDRTLDGNLHRLKSRNIPEARRAPKGGGLCQGAATRARARRRTELGVLKDFHCFVNSGVSFTGP